MAHEHGDTHTPHDTSHGHSHDSAYMKVFMALAVFTVISFTVSETFSSKAVTILMILGIATVKALLVATIFMHLKFDWKKIYIVIVPALVLAVVLVFLLTPDIVFGPREHRFQSSYAAAGGASPHQPSATPAAKHE
jgi:caa(3)-type oxidase subunit IV